MKKCFLRSIFLLTTLVLSNLQAQNSVANQQTFWKTDLAVQAIRQAYSIRTGLEIATSDTGNQRINLDFSGKDYSAVFDALVAQRPVYAWTMENGLYDVYPSAKAESLSDVSIRSYVLKNANRLDASQELNKLPELQKWLSDHHASRKEIINQSTYRNAGQRISLNLTNVTLRTVLDELVNSFSDTQWTISYHGGGMQYVAIYF